MQPFVFAMDMKSKRFLFFGDGVLVFCLVLFWVFVVAVVGFFVCLFVGFFVTNKIYFVK